MNAAGRSRRKLGAKVHDLHISSLRQHDFRVRRAIADDRNRLSGRRWGKRWGRLREAFIKQGLRIFDEVLHHRILLELVQKKMT